MTFYLQLGRLSHLSIFELQTLFETKVEEWIPGFVKMKTNDKNHFLSTIDATAGVVKVLQEIYICNTPQQAQDHILSVLSKKEKPTFSLRTLGNEVYELSHSAVKKELRKQKITSRYIESTKGLSASVLLHQEVDEFYIFFDQQGEEKYIVTQTVWVQDIDDWSKRDVGKPYRDVKKGMLPAKLARMMVNFVSPDIQKKQNRRLYDPFCGTGTVLIEASLLGWNVLGSDIKHETTHKVSQNMFWLQQQYDVAEQEALFVRDATHVTEEDVKGKVDAIVTEPFLGKQNPQDRELRGMFKGLEKLYWGILKQWQKILTSNGEVVIVTPKVVIPVKTYSLHKLIDRTQDLGYSMISGPLEYKRPQSRIIRDIYILRMKQ